MVLFQSLFPFIIYLQAFTKIKMNVIIDFRIKRESPVKKINCAELFIQIQIANSQLEVQHCIIRIKNLGLFKIGFCLLVKRRIVKIKSIPFFQAVHSSIKSLYV